MGCSENSSLTGCIKDAVNRVLSGGPVYLFFLCLFGRPIDPQLGFAKIDVVVPYDAISSLVCADVSEERIILERVKRQFIQKARTIVHLNFPSDERYKQPFR